MLCDRGRGAAMIRLALLIGVLSVALGPVLPCDAAAAAVSSGPSVRFQGTLLQGVGSEMLQSGGAAFTMQLSEGYLSSISVDEMRHALAEGFQSNVNVSAQGTGTCWNSVAADLFETAQFTVSSHRKVLRVVFGSASAYNCTVKETVTVRLPPYLFDAATAPLAGPEFLIVPEGRITFDVEGGWAVTSTEVRLRFSGPDVDVLGRLPHKVVAGADCNGGLAPLEARPAWDPSRQIMRFVPLQGGSISVCYTLENEASRKHIFVRAKGALLVSGPEGLVAETPFPRAQVEFKATIFGTNLTSQDILVLSTSPCSTLIDPHEIYDITLNSASKASCYVAAPHDGLHNVCYFRNGASAFTHVTSLLVQKGGDLLIEEDASQVVVSEDALLVRSVRVQFFSLGQATLSLDGHTLNVSHFTWTGGDITGGGLINTMRTNCIIDAAARTLVVEFTLHNHGTMQFDLRFVTLSPTGTVSNFGDLNLLVNGTNGDPAVISCQGSKSGIFNGMSGHLRIASARPRGAVVIACPIVNRGSITIEGDLRVIFRSLAQRDGGALHVMPNSYAACEHCMMSGRLHLHHSSHLRFCERAAQLTRVTVEGGGTVTIESPASSIDSIEVTDATKVYFRGALEPVGVEVYGFNSFGPQTLVVLGQARFASKGFLAHLSMAGRLLCHIPSVEFGDNVVIHAHLTTVMFGVGERGQRHANLVPQRIPQNATFIIPKNATLVIMDVGNLTQRELTDGAMTPRICAQYLVIPMHVEVRGRVMLWGCALLPFGGKQGGLIFGPSVAEITASVEYAFCRNVLMDEHACIPVFEGERGHPPLSGIVFGGDHEFDVPQLLPGSVDGDAIYVDQDGNVVTREHPNSRAVQLSVDVVELLPGATVKALHPLQLLASQGLYIHAYGSLSLMHGGHFATKRLTVDGLIDVNAEAPLAVTGGVAVGPEGRIRIDPSDICAYPMSIRDGIRFNNGATIQCRTPLNLSTGASTALIRAPRGVSGNPTLDAQSCTGELAAALVTDSSGLGLRLDGKESSATASARATGILASIAGAALLLLALSFRAAPGNMVMELHQRLELPLQLSFPEFSSYMPNFIAVGSIALDALFLASAAFHPLVPLPVSASRLVNLSTHTMLAHLAPGTRAPLLITVLVLVGVWGLLWLPLVLKRISERIKRLLHQQEHDMQRYGIQVFFQFHTVASFASLMLFIPLISFLLDPIACSTVLVSTAGCGSLQPHVGPSILCACIFAFLAPYSATNRAFPFGHPPYQRDLDIRFKRSFTFVQYSLYFLQACVWKVFAGSPTQLLLASLAIVAMLFILTATAAPCAYSNINTLKMMSFMFPMWSIVCSLLQVARFGAHPQFVCASSDPLYVALMLLGMLIISGGLVVSLRKCVRPLDEIGENPLSIHLHALMEHYVKIEKRKMEMYNTDDSGERERISDNVSALRIQYLQLLNAYRRKKERLVLPYYLGGNVVGGLLVAPPDDEGAVEMVADVTGAAHRDGSPKSGFAMPIKTIDSASSGLAASTREQGAAVEEELLTVDQMAQFVRGPPLGSGSYGVVHMGMLPSGKLVAVKEVPISRKKRSTLSSVKREVDLLRTLVHPNVIRYYGCHVTAKQISVFMEFAVGGSLTSLIRKFDKLSEATMRMYTQQILQGLCYLHSRNIVHRDIKGENVLIDSDGVAKLADFGCSKGLADIANKSQQGCGTLVGSPFWMSPEVIRNEEYGTKTDIWSLGCTVVEMLNGGDPPWHEKFDNVYSAMYFIGSTTELPSNIPEDLSDQCKDFLGRCFERDVSKRATAAELLRHPWIAANQKASPTVTASSTESPIGQREWSELFDASGSASGTHRSTLTCPTRSEDWDSHAEGIAAAVSRQSDTPEEHEGAATSD